MEYTVLLSRNENIKEVEAEEQARFIKSILEALEIPLDWNPDEPLTISKKMELRKQLLTFNINIIDDMDGGVKIFANNEVIGEWKKCHYKLKEDMSQLEPSKRFYLEMNINFWSSFEDIE